MIRDRRDRGAFLLVSGLRLFLLPVVVSLFMVGLLAAQAPADKPAVENQAPARPPAPTKQQLAEMQRLSETAEKYVAEGKTAEAIAAGDQLIALYGKLYGGVDTRVVSWLANLHLRCDDLDGARGMLQSSLQMAKERFGQDDWRTTDARLELADVDLYAKLTSAQRREVFAATAQIHQAVALFHANKPAEALPMFEQGLTTRKRLLGAEHSEYAKSLRQLSQMYHKQGALDRAGPPLREALEIQKRVLGTKHPDYSGSLNDLGALYFNQRDYSHARTVLEESLDLSKQQLGTNHPDYASGLCNLAVLYSHMGDYTRAESLHVEALEIRKNTLGTEHPAYAFGLQELAGVLKRQGNYDRAENLYKQASELRKKVLGEQHPAYAQTLNDLATLYMRQGEYVRAEPLFRESLNILEHTVGPRHTEYATGLNNLGNLYRSQGDRGRAIELFREAVQITKQVQGGHQRTYTEKLYNLALTYMDQGDFAIAEPLLREALEVAEKDLGTNSVDYANCLMNLFTFYYRQRDYVHAEPPLRQALEIRKAVLGTRHPDYAAALLSLAELQLERGEYAEAEPRFKESLAITQKTFSAGSPECAYTLSRLADLYQAQGDYAQAEPRILEAVQLARRHLEQTAGIQSERLQLAMRMVVWCYISNYLDITAHSDASPDDVYLQVMNWKGMVGARQQSFHQARRSLAAAGNTKALELEKALAAATHQLSALSRSTNVAGSEKEQQLAALGEKVEGLQKQLAAASVEYQKEFQQTRRTPADLRRVLPADTVLIDLLSYEFAEGGFQPVAADSFGPQKLVAFVLRADQPVRRFELGLSEPIQRAITAWRKQFGATDSRSDAGAELRRVLWQPLEQAIAGAKAVLISPNATLAPLPWGALPGRQPGSYLIDEYSFALIPIPSLLPDILSNGTSPPAREPSLMLVGDVNFGAEPSKTDAAPGNQVAARGDQPLHWQALPGTRDEVAAIKGEFHKRFGGGQITELTGDRATPSAVREEAGKHEYLHFSTHGFFAPAQIRSALSDKLPRDRLAGEETVSRESMSGVHPGLLSGLVLAGANQPVAAEREDGILTALEVSEMDLSRVQLATLSACETGLGETAGGEGMLGLQRAFQTAGAKTVIASLWKVPDRATQALMSRFHENLWQKKMSKLESLREAQRWLIQAGLTQPELRRGLEIEDDQPPAPKSGTLSPYYWAAFVLSGDWR